MAEEEKTNQDESTPLPVEQQGSEEIVPLKRIETPLFDMDRRRPNGPFAGNVYAFQKHIASGLCPHGNPYEKLCGTCVARATMRRFIIDRKDDITGISGTGVILYGTEYFPGGPCQVYWLKTETTGQYPSMDVIKSTHCYNNNAQVIYLD